MRRLQLSRPRSHSYLRITRKSKLTTDYRRVIPFNTDVISGALGQLPKRLFWRSERLGEGIGRLNVQFRPLPWRSTAYLTSALVERRFDWVRGFPTFFHEIGQCFVRSRWNLLAPLVLIIIDGWDAASGVLTLFEAAKSPVWQQVHLTCWEVEGRAIWSQWFVYHVFWRLELCDFVVDFFGWWDLELGLIHVLILFVFLWSHIWKRYFLCFLRVLNTRPRRLDHMWLQHEVLFSGVGPRRREMLRIFGTELRRVDVGTARGLRHDALRHPQSTVFHVAWVLSLHVIRGGIRVIALLPTMIRKLGKRCPIRAISLRIRVAAFFGSLLLQHGCEVLFQWDDGFRFIGH